ncbi:DUF5995 family protein [Actinoplanes subglobosus]|uniref:DUF5995 family protein n=1 Tax=Actinoplanes subglobosus TaxID=1547892 RepID=A0ABV8IKG2_9ACTN
MTQPIWGPVQQEMSDLLQRHPDDVPGVVDLLAQLQVALCRVPPLLDSNPLADFNKLYLTITENVLERLYAGKFKDPAFLARLDVEFAARYFDALRYWTSDRPACPGVWAGLFTRIPGPDARALPSAVAGVNAHINFDLPFALVTTFDHLGSDPVDGSDQHHDYLQVNDIFAEEIPGLRRGYLDRWQLLIDTMNGDLDDWWQGEMVEYTRNVAWRNAQKIWAIRHDMDALKKERRRLDNTATGLGKLLLSPFGAFLQ